MNGLQAHRRCRCGAQLTARQPNWDRCAAHAPPEHCGRCGDPLIDGHCRQACNREWFWKHDAAPELVALLTKGEQA